MMTRKQEVATLAGIAIGVGFAVIRMASAHTLAGYLLALGLTIAEIGLVYLLHHKAKELDSAMEEWQAHDQTRQQLDGRCRAAETEVERKEQMVMAIGSRRDAILRQIREQREQHFDLAAAKEAAQGAIRAGYLAGIARNKGILLGGSDN